MYLNPVLTGQFLAFFLGEDGKQLITYDDPARLRWAGIGLAVQLIMVIVMCMFSLRKKKTVHAWSASAARKARPGYVPTVALIAPILPVLLLVVLNVPIILGFIIGSIAFALLAPLGLFRGPLTLFGCGAATLGILKGIGFSTPYLFALMVIPSITMNVSICMTQSWIAWGVSYAKVSTREHLKKTLPVAWIVCIIMQAITYIMFG